MKRTNISSGTIWEKNLGYSRAVRIGPHVAISSTAAITPGGELFAPGDAYEQTRYILAKIVKVLEAAGGNIHHIIRTRIYLAGIEYYEEVGRAHAEFFGELRPTTTIFQTANLLMEGTLLEIEADAIVYGEAMIEENTEVK